MDHILLILTFHGLFSVLLYPYRRRCGHLSNIFVFVPRDCASVGDINIIIRKPDTTRPRLNNWLTVDTGRCCQMRGVSKKREKKIRTAAKMERTKEL